MFFNATAVKGGQEIVHAPIILNSDVIMGVYHKNRILLSRQTLDEISMQIFKKCYICYLIHFLASIHLQD